MKEKKGQFQLPSSVIWGVVGFMVAAIVGILIVTTLANGNLFAQDTSTKTVTDESGYANPVFANSTGYTLSGYNSSWSSITLTGIFNTSSEGAGDGGWNITVATTNITVTNGVLYNATAGWEYDNISVNYTYVLSSTSAAQTSVSAIDANLTSGINTVVLKFSTIFTVVAIVVILAILGVLILIVRKYGLGSYSGNFSQ